MKLDFIHPDSRSKFAIWCKGEGWLGGENVNVFHTYDQAIHEMNKWKEENPTCEYEVREIVAPDKMNLCGKDFFK